MSRCRWSVVRLLSVLAVLLPAAVWGTTVMQMDLADLCQRADRIFRGRVVEITSGEVAVGGGLMPTVTYVLEVEEAFKGAFTAAKGRRLEVEGGRRRARPRPRPLAWISTAAGRPNTGAVHGSCAVI